METKLPIEILTAMESGAHEVCVTDSVTKKSYYIIDDQTHQKFRNALREQEDWLAIQNGINQADHGKTLPLNSADNEIRQHFDFPPR